MAADRILSQQEIDTVFARLRGGQGRAATQPVVVPYDFRRPDAIPKEQLRAIHLLHENFARSVASSLSAYLRAYVMANLVAVEQLSYAEFASSLPSPTVLITLRLSPIEGTAVLELDPSLVFPILEMMLGGGAISSPPLEREITEIEKHILESVVRILRQELHEAWRPIAELSFEVVGYETEPQLLQVLGPHEAVVAISMEVKVGEHAGMLNLGIPSVAIKMLRQRFSQQWSLRRVGGGQSEQERVFQLIQGAQFTVEARLLGSKLQLGTLLGLKPGDVVVFDHPIQRPVRLLINGRERFEAQVCTDGRKRWVRLGQLILPE